MTADEIVWRSPGSSRGLPGPFRLTHPLVFVGRTAERERLAAAWREASGGRRRAVLVAGEPGIGKTRLAMEMAQAFHREGATVLYGRCEEEAGPPYQPFVDVLRQYLADRRDEELSAHVDIHGEALGYIIPEVFPPAPSAARIQEPEAERWRLFEAVTALLAQGSSSTPMVLVLDDLHWAGKPALLLLKHLLVSEAAETLLVIGLFRDADLSPQHPLFELLADLRREPGVERLALSGLRDAEVVELIEAVAGHELDEDRVALAYALWRETDGNPFFVSEILRDLQEIGALREGADWKGDEAPFKVPESLREVIGRRVARLGEGAHQTLVMASVIGPEFDFAVLRELMRASDDDLLAYLEEAARAGLVAEVAETIGRFEFTHNLIRNAVYESQRAPRRRLMHRQVAQALEELSGREPEPRLGELSYQWCQGAESADLVRAVDWCRRAGDLERDRLAYEVAATHYDRALKLIDLAGEGPTLRRCELLLAMGDARRRASDPRYRETMMDAAGLARRLGSAVHLALAALGCARLGSFYAQGGLVDEPLVALCEEALAALEPSSSVLRARLQAQLAIELFWTPDRERRAALSGEALAIAREVGDPVVLAEALSARIVALWDPLTTLERRSLARELGELAGQLHSRDMAFQGHMFQGVSCYEAGDEAAFARELDTASALADQLHQPFLRWLAKVILTGRALLEGPAVAEASVLETFQLGQALKLADAPATFAAEFYVMRWDEGRLADLVDSIATQVEQMPGIPAWRAVVALAYAEAGRMPEAEATFEKLAKNGLDLPMDNIWLLGTSVLGEVAVFLGDRARAETLYERLLPFADQLVVAGNGALCLGSLHRTLGLLATTLRHFDVAERHFEQALAANARIGARTFLVRTQRAYASMLLDRADPEDVGTAATVVSAALAAAEELGMGQEVDRLRALAARTGRPAGAGTESSPMVADRHRHY